MYEEHGKEKEGVMGKLSKKLENHLELCRGPQGSREDRNKETQAGNTHKSHSHLTGIYGLVLTSPKQEGKESIVGLSIHREKQE